MTIMSFIEESRRHPCRSFAGFGLWDLEWILVNVDQKIGPAIFYFGLELFVYNLLRLRIGSQFHREH